ncbi:MAG: hypothetical protein OIN87_11920 [Candidatus Methanoperedens sp.]|nr:hypothetical protein [Candidatus Methanoperedens sp.]
MTSELKQIIDLIKKEHPDYSEDDIKAAILSHIESNLSEIILKLKLPAKKSPISSLVDRFRQARSGVRNFRLSGKNSGYELLSVLDTVKEILLESREIQNANTIAEDMQMIGSASTTLEGHLLSAEAHIATLINKQSTSYVATNDNLKKLEQLSEND